MNKKLLFLATIIITTLLFVNSVTALDSIGTYKKGEEIRITQVCSDATYINISSITYPNSTRAVSNIQMNSAGSGEFYYNFSLTDSLGRYDIRGISDGCTETFATYFEITQTGIANERTYYSFFIGIAVLLGLIFLIISFIYDDYMMIFSAISFITSGIFVLYFPLGDTQTFITQGISIVLNGIGLVLIGAYIIRDWLPNSSW